MDSQYEERSSFKDRPFVGQIAVVALVVWLALFIASLYADSPTYDIVSLFYALTVLVVVMIVEVIDRAHGWFMRLRRAIARGFH